jgi:hypothetical protein
MADSNRQLNPGGNLQGRRVHVLPGFLRVAAIGKAARVLQRPGDNAAVVIFLKAYAHEHGNSTN